MIDGWIAWTILVSYLSVLIQFLFSNIGYCLNVFVWLWIIGFTLASLGEGAFFSLRHFFVHFFFQLDSWFLFYHSRLFVSTEKYL